MAEKLNVKASYQGGCACGAIRYECNEAPVAEFNCHCTDCQQASGGAFVTVALVREKALTMLSGKPKYHRSHCDAGRWTDRGFCGECGTPLFAKGEIGPGYISIKPGSLDNSSWFHPTIDTWAPSAPQWLAMDAGIPKSKKTPNVLKARNTA